MNLGGLGQFLRDLARKALGVGRERFAMEVAKILKDDLIETFATATDPMTGKKWVPVKKTKGAPLIDTGTMLRSALTASMQPMVIGNVIRWELDAPAYSAIHQFGTSRVPQRRFFGLRRESIEKIKSRLGSTVIEAMVGGRP